MIKILVVDDHTIVREGLKKILVDTPDMVVADEASNGQEVIKKVGNNDYDLVLLDISLPGRSGLDVLKQLKCTKPKVRKYITPSLAEKLVFELEVDVRKLPHETLSDREYQVMCMIGSGKTVKEIAETLSLSVRTISTHRAHILKKMKMENNAQLTHYAIKNALVD
jgi:two-component system invasion response regulator UvrY